MGMIDNLRENLANMQAHPFQTGARAVGSIFGGPMLGYGLGKAFQGYNNNQFNNAAQGVNSRIQSQSNDMTNKMDNTPLGGPLGQSSGPNDNSALANAFSGQSPGSSSGYNMSQQFGQPPGGMSSLMGFLPQQPPQMPNGSLFTNPQYASQAPANFESNHAGPLSGGGMGSLGAQSSMGSALPGGGYSGVMNGASPSMMADFAAPTNGDWTQMLGYTGKPKPNVSQAK